MDNCGSSSITQWPICHAKSAISAEFACRNGGICEEKQGNFTCKEYLYDFWELLIIFEKKGQKCTVPIVLLIDKFFFSFLFLWINGSRDLFKFIHVFFILKLKDFLLCSSVGSNYLKGIGLQ